MRMTRRTLLQSAASAAALGILKPRPALAATDLHHIVCPGHSLMFGTNSVSALSTSQPFANKILAGGTTLSDLVAINSVEDPPCGVANQLRSLAGSGYDVVVTRNAHPSASYNNMKKGGNTSDYADSITNAQLLPAAAAAAGKTYEYSAIACILGENDNVAVTGPQYALDMVQFQSDYSNDLNGGKILPLFLHQFDGWNSGIHATTTPTMESDPTTPCPAQGQWWAMRDNPGKIFLVAPLYRFWGGYSDGIHLTNTNYRILGEMMGKWMKYVLIDGTTFGGLAPRLFTSSANVITARFWLRAGRSLVIDTSTVPSQGAGRGFEFFDNSGSPPAISSVTVSGDTATITLASTPSGGNQRLRYAYTAVAQAGGGTTGCGAGNLRNDDPTVGQGSGANLYDWAFMFDEALPFAWPKGGSAISSKAAISLPTKR